MTEPARDPGLQPERTSLAWRRTALACATAGIVSMRLLQAVFGTWSFALGVTGVVLALAIGMWDRRRWARSVLASRARASGGPPAAVTLLVLGAGAASLVFVLFD
ncbi:DUF202 domain-containing protein [Leucobacter sp. L43]|uniref:DUF202 domain-containing protein n=1 Tax=Leucobacter sp. L43 TaxID=2798040 RepID=UPI0019050557|nr:DUF202 domain-containing protein [Leucobacter sp. L43]